MKQSLFGPPIGALAQTQRVFLLKFAKHCVRRLELARERVRCPMRKICCLAVSLPLVFFAAQALGKPAIIPLEPPLTYADAADFALASTIVAEVRITAAERVDGKLMPVPPSTRRYLVNASVTALIRGAAGLPPSISYLTDVRADSLGRYAALKKQAVIVFAVAVPDRPGQIRLVAPDAQQSSTPKFSAQARAILAEALGPNAPPRILRVGDAFQVPGTVPDESETQIFLAADDGRPLSLSIWRRQNEAPRWSVSLGEIVDESALPPKRDTLLWYRLACFLPRTLPAASTDSLDADGAKAAAEDYATVIKGLGPCERTRLAAR